MKKSSIYKPGKLSVVIVNYNGYKYLKALVASILKSKTKLFEIIIVDNGSSHLELKKIKKLSKASKKVKTIFLHKNFGPALARNIGVKNSNGEYLSFLDNDTHVHKKWASSAIAYFNKHKKVGVIQCKLLLESDHKKIDYVGEYLGSNGFLVQQCPAGTTDSGQFNKPKKILAAKSAGMFIRRSAFNKAGGFDDSYFIYVEETDLGWRSWLMGYEAHYLPTSIVYHHFGTSTVILGAANASNLAKFHGPKNYLTTLYKNLSTKMLLRIFPTHLLLWICFVVYRLASLKILDAYYMGLGIIYFFINFKKINKSRKEIQSNLSIEMEEEIKKLVVKRPLWYFISKATNKQTIGNANSY